LPRGALLWRCMVTWVGGIGVILLAMILLPILNIGGMQLLRNADFNTLGKILPRTKSIVLSIGAVYLALTLACTLSYLWAGMPGFDALSHGFSTVATGGMANHDNSFAEFPPSVQWVATFFMLLGAMSFSRYVQFARGEPQALLRDSQIRAFLTIYLCLAAALLLARLLAAQPFDVATVREVLFSLASVLTTTGFAATDYSLWGPLAETIFFCAMMICGCSGSTSGGPKVFRYQLLFGAISGELRRLHSPNVVFTQRFQGIAVPDTWSRPGQCDHRRRRFADQRRSRPRSGDRPCRHLRLAVGPGEVGRLLPHDRRPARAADRLRALHRRLLARLTAKRIDAAGRDEAIVMSLT
jgi:trk system potassium uptake protein TrkH